MRPFARSAERTEMPVATRSCSDGCPSSVSRRCRSQRRRLSTRARHTPSPRRAIRTIAVRLAVVWPSRSLARFVEPTALASPPRPDDISRRLQMYAFWMVVNYREAYGMVSSPLESRTFSFAAARPKLPPFDPPLAAARIQRHSVQPRIAAPWPDFRHAQGKRLMPL